MIGDPADAVAQLFAGERLTGAQRQSVENLPSCVIDQVADRIDLADPVLLPFVDLDQDQHVAQVVDQRDDRLADLDADVALVEVEVGDPLQVLLEQHLVVIAAAGEPGEEPLLLGIHDLLQFLLGEEGVPFEADVLDADQGALVDLEGEQRFVVGVDLAVDGDFGSVVAFLDVLRLDRGNAPLGFVGIVDAGGAQRHHPQQLFTADLLVPLELHAAYQRPLGDLENQDLDPVLRIHPGRHIGKTPESVDRLHGPVDLHGVNQLALLQRDGGEDRFGLDPAIAAHRDVSDLVLGGRPERSGRE
jgi:hypothetical protein